MRNSNQWLCSLSYMELTIDYLAGNAYDLGLKNND